jgi:chemotaxis signal transduction protein
MSPAATAEGRDRYLMVQVGEDVCLLPLDRVRRIVRDLDVTPLPGTTAELKGLAEFGGEPLPVLDLGQLVKVTPGPHPPYSVTVIAYAGPSEAWELIGMAVDAVLEVVTVPADSIAAGGDGLVRGEALVRERQVRVISLAALGRRA